MNNIIMVPNTLILVIDIAKDNHYGQFIVNGEYIKPFLIKNTKESFDCLLKIIDELTEKYDTVNTLVRMEPTVHYWKNIAYYLKK